VSATNPDIAFCLKRIGQDTATWNTLVVTGAADTAIPAADLWAVWADLERWPLWSPLHRSVTWASGAGLAAGSAFEQHIDLGFPIGTTTEHVTIDVLEPARRVAWAGDSNGVRSCHLWSFTPALDGGAHVSNVEAFTGIPVAMLRPLVAHRWQRLFQAAVDGLIRYATADRS
jgi:hypothetical protein